MKINYLLTYNEKLNYVNKKIYELLLENCSVYLHKKENIGDDEVCLLCGTYSDECEMLELTIKYGGVCVAYSYICTDCAEKEKLINE